MPSPPYCAVIVALGLTLFSACSRPPTDEPARSSSSQALPFDRQPASAGVSPTQSVIPSNSQLPEGTSISIRLQSPLSSKTSRAGDRFDAVLDQPVEVDGLTLLAGGIPATGRILEAKPARSTGSALDNGYLRLVLVSLNVSGKTVAIETSSIFLKGGSREERSPASAPATAGAQKDIVLSVERRLNFRLAQTVDLKQQSQ